MYYIHFAMEKTNFCLLRMTENSKGTKDSQSRNYQIFFSPMLLGRIEELIGTAIFCNYDSILKIKFSSLYFSWRKKKIFDIDRDRIRTCNLRIRSPMPYPLGHTAWSGRMILFKAYSLIFFRKTKRKWPSYQMATFLFRLKIFDDNNFISR